MLRAPFAHWRIRRRGHFTEMSRLSRSVAARAAAGAAGPRVLVVQLKEGPVLGAYSAIFAQALRLRGATVAALTCGGGQPICEVGWGRHAYPVLCDRCSYFTQRWADAQGIELFRLSEAMPWGRNASRAPLETSGVPEVEPAESTKISVPRWFRAERFEQFPLAAEVAGDFAVASQGVEQAVAPVLERFAPDIVIVHNGSVTAEFVVKAMAERRGARVVTYADGVPPGSLILSDGEAAVHQQWDEPWQELRDHPLSAAQREQIESYIQERSATRRGGGDPLGALGLHGFTRVVTLFTNISWDSACLDRDVGFASMRDWVVDAIAAARDTPETALVVRIHPDEITWGTCEPVEESIREAFPELPANVRVVSPGEAVDSYSLMEASDLVLTYTSTTGVEAAVRGRPVAVCGDAHYRGKGFTIDVTGPGELRDLVAGAEPVLPPSATELAWRFAFMFFYRVSVPFPAVGATSLDALGSIPEDARALAPGADPYLDFVCDRILTGGEFVLPDPLAGDPAVPATL